MANKNIKTREGFTIIEVVLVLAIAGLIFLMVFIALPALQSSQRDTQRQQDMSRVNNALVNYQRNNSTKNNNLPGQASFLASELVDDDGYFLDECKNNIACRFVRDYLNSASGETDADGNLINTFNDPDGVPYNVVITTNAASNDEFYYDNISENGGGLAGNPSEDGGVTIDGGPAAYQDHIVYIIPGGKCSGESVVESTLRHFAIMYRTEGSGVYCVDSQ